MLQSWIKLFAKLTEACLLAFVFYSLFLWETVGWTVLE